MALETQLTELDRLGFKIVSRSDNRVIGVRQKWHWDCIATKLTYIIFVRAIDELTRADIDMDRADLLSRAHELDPSILPRGFQKGTAIIAAYVATKVRADAREQCTTKQKRRFAFFYFPTAREASSDTTFYLKETPLWGAIYFGKFRYLAQCLLDPHRAPKQEPISKLGATLSIFLLLWFVILLLGVLGTLLS
ncbi:MAG: hypothetical protein AAFY11_02230 [Cyanobacteria bacterium J06641_5]